MRVIVCGGRNYTDDFFICCTLGFFHKAASITELIHGGAPGADTIAGKWAASYPIKTTVYAADWDRYGPSAGPRRNELMAASGADLLIAFPGGRGTDDMMRKARAAGMSIFEARRR